MRHATVVDFGIVQGVVEHASSVSPISQASAAALEGTRVKTIG